MKQEIQGRESLQLFDDQPIRTAWDEANEEWYFAIVDVVAVLTGSPNPQTYWRVMKKRLRDQGNETVTNCNALRLKSADGKRRLTDVANTEQLLRLIQSIPSKKADPFKLWLAQVGRERIEETLDPELIAGDARKAIEAGTGKSVITGKTAAQLNHVVARMIGASADVADGTDEEEQSIDM